MGVKQLAPIWPPEPFLAVWAPTTQRRAPQQLLRRKWTMLRKLKMFSKEQQLPVVGPDDEIFSFGHFLSDYLPRRLLFFVLPLTVAILFFTGDANAIVFLFLFTGVMIITQGYNYHHAAKQHDELAGKYGESYFKKLNAELERVGFNRLIDRFWTGLEPK
ncbi:MAG: hypothetical protein ACFB00_12435 [Parvularculaceae bacterium]